MFFDKGLLAGNARVKNNANEMHFFNDNGRYMEKVAKDGVGTHQHGKMEGLRGKRAEG